MCEREWIIHSLLDTDFYKFPMGQIAFRHYPEVRVKYGFKNRTPGIHLARYIDPTELNRQLDHVRDLRFTHSDLHYLRGTNEYGERMFREEYLQFLSQLQLPAYRLERRGEDYILEFEGLWAEAIYWEIPALAIVSELYGRSLMQEYSDFDKELVLATGRLRLKEKILKLRAHPEITFTDFGTRRRFAGFWQDYLVGVLRAELPQTQFLGTSNVFLANKYGLEPKGTSAHEMHMVLSSIMHGSDEEIRASHNRSLRDWWEEFGPGLSIALSDTYGSDFFFRDMTAEQAEKWKGVRQDSGDPIEFGEKAIAFYQNHGVDPTQKLIVFSDGLNVDAIIKISDHFQDRIKTTFGWGTDLTHDVGFKAPSIVIKVKEACGHGAVKLSDDAAKAMGKPEDIERFRRIFAS